MEYYTPAGVQISHFSMHTIFFLPTINIPPNPEVCALVGSSGNHAPPFISFFQNLFLLIFLVSSSLLPRHIYLPICYCSYPFFLVSFLKLPFLILYVLILKTSKCHSSVTAFTSFRGRQCSYYGLPCYYTMQDYRIICLFCCFGEMFCLSIQQQKKQVVQVADKVSGQKVKGINLVIRQQEMRVQSETTRVKKQNFSSSKNGEKYDLTYAMSHTKGKEEKG